MSVKHQDHFKDIFIDAIDYIEAKGNYLLCYCNEKGYRYRSTIKPLLALPASVTFIRIHKGFLVNKSRIKKYNTRTVLVNQKTITVSRNYKKKLFPK